MQIERERNAIPQLTPTRKLEEENRKWPIHSLFPQLTPTRKLEDRYSTNNVYLVSPQLTPTRKLEAGSFPVRPVGAEPPTHAHAQIGSRHTAAYPRTSSPQLTPTRKLEVPTGQVLQVGLVPQLTPTRKLEAGLGMVLVQVVLPPTHAHAQIGRCTARESGKARLAPNSRPRANWKRAGCGDAVSHHPPNSRPRANWKFQFVFSFFILINPQLTPTRKLEALNSKVVAWDLVPPTHAHAQIGSSQAEPAWSGYLPQLTPTRKLEDLGGLGFEPVGGPQLTPTRKLEGQVALDFRYGRQPPTHAHAQIGRGLAVTPMMAASAPNSRPRANWKEGPCPQSCRWSSPNSRPRANWKQPASRYAASWKTPNSRPRANWKLASRSESGTAHLPQLTPTRKLEAKRFGILCAEDKPPTHAHAQIGSSRTTLRITAANPQLTPTRKLEEPTLQHRNRPHHPQLTPTRKLEDGGRRGIRRDAPPTHAHAQIGRRGGNQPRKGMDPPTHAHAQIGSSSRCSFRFVSLPPTHAHAQIGS